MTTIPSPVTAGDAFRAFAEAPVVGLRHLTRADPILVVAPHADDETLGCGGLIAQAVRDGVDVGVALMTDGVRSHRASRAYPPERLRAAREAESRAALQRLGLADPALLALRQPDGFLADAGSEAEALVDALCRFAEDRQAGTIFVTWEADPHPDHLAAARLAERAARRLGLRLFAYPIWGLMLDPGTVLARPPGRAVRLDIAAERALKRRAIDCYATQTAGVITDAVEPFQLGAEDIARFCTDFETFMEVRAGAERSVPTSHFDGLYAKSDDPWDYAGSDYENRKYDHTLALLPDRRYANAFELGCSVGYLTRRLAERCDRLLSADCAEAAVTRTRARLADAPHVTIRQLRAPQQLPEGRFDLIMLSEVLYFFSTEELKAVARFAAAHLAPGGICLVVNFLGDTESPQTGDAASMVFIETAGLPVREAARTEFYRIDVLEKPA